MYINPIPEPRSVSIPAFPRDRIIRKLQAYLAIIAFVQAPRKVGVERREGGGVAESIIHRVVEIAVYPADRPVIADYHACMQ